MTKGNRIVILITAICLALGLGTIIGGTLVSRNTPEKIVTVTEVAVPEVPARALAGKRITLVATPAANRATVSEIQQTLTKSAAIVTGIITLTPKFADNSSEAELSTLLINSVPRGVRLPTDRDQNAGRITGTVVGSLAQQPSDVQHDTNRSAFVDRMVQNGFFVDGSYFGSSDAVVVITAAAKDGTSPASEKGVQGVTIAKFAQGVAQRNVATVLAAGSGAEKVNSPIFAAEGWRIPLLRTVTNADQPAGQARIVLALRDMLTMKRA